MTTLAQSMCNGASKRPRANTSEIYEEPTNNMTKTVLTKDLGAVMDSLDEATIRRLVIETAQESPLLVASIIKEAEAKKFRESEEIIDFSSFLRQAEDCVDRLLGLRPSKQFENSIDADLAISGAITSVTKNIANHSSFDSKKNALATLCDIGVLVMETGEEIGKSLRMSFCDGSIESSMRSVIGTMTDDERRKLYGPLCVDLATDIEYLIERGEAYEMLEDLVSLYDEYFMDPAVHV